MGRIGYEIRENGSRPPLLSDGPAVYRASMKAILLILLGTLIALPGLFAVVAGEGGVAVKVGGSLAIAVGVGVFLYGLVLNHKDHTQKR